VNLAAMRDDRLIEVEKEAGENVNLPKPMTSGLNVKERFGKQDFVYVAADDVYLCPAGEQLIYHYTNEEDGKTLRLLDQRVPGLRAEGPMHDRQRTTDLTLGA
jgi:hypothetical protein